jgi:hypothetical protein
MPEQRLENGRPGSTVAGREPTDGIMGIERLGGYTRKSWHRVSADIDYHLSGRRLQHSMLRDECRWLLIVSHASRSRSMNNADGGVAMNLKVQMRMIESVSVPNQTDLLTATNRLALGHRNFVQMRVQRISVFKLAAFVESVTDNDHVTPRTFEISGQSNHAVSDRMDRRSIDRSGPGRAHPIFTKVTTDIKAARHLAPFRVWATNRKVEPIRN